MFDQILNLVKDQIGGNPQVAGAIPKEREDEVHREVATQVDRGLKQQAAVQGGAGGLLSQLSGSMDSGNPVVNTIQGGLVGALSSKFGLPPAAAGAVAGAIPGILQKFAHKAKDPDDPGITHESLNKSLGDTPGGGLGEKLGKFF